MKAKLVLCNVPASKDNLPKINDFYSKLLGINLERALTDQVESHHMPISNDGIYLTVTSRFNEKESVTCFFAVADLAATIAELKQCGGKVIAEYDLPMPERVMEDYKQFVSELNEKKAEVTNSLGKTAIIQDPEGNAVGLIQLEKHAHVFYKVGDFAEDLDEKQKKAHLKAKELAQKHF